MRMRTRQRARTGNGKTYGTTSGLATRLKCNSTKGVPVDLGGALGGRACSGHGSRKRLGTWCKVVSYAATHHGGRGGHCGRRSLGRRHRWQGPRGSRSHSKRANWKGAGRRVADGVFVGIEQTSQETRVFVTLFSLSTSLREVIQSPRGESIA